MAIVFFLERLVMTVLEGPITNDQFLACTSVSIITAWRTKALWDWTTFLVFQTRQGCTNSRELAFSTEKGEDNKDKTCHYTAAHLTRVFLNEEKQLFINDTQADSYQSLIMCFWGEKRLGVRLRRADFHRKLRYKQKFFQIWSSEAGYGELCVCF